MRPLKQITDTLRRAIIAELQKVNSDVVDTELGLEAPMALAHSAEIRSLELLLQEVANEATPRTAQSRENSTIGKLEEYGEFVDVFRFSATRGRYKVMFIGTTGSTIPANTILKASNNVSLFLIDDVVFASGVAFGEVMTQEAGAANRPPNDTTIPLIITNGIFGVEQEAFIQPNGTPPRDIEDIEDFRRRIEAAYQTKSHGGRKADFRLWAQNIEGVKQVYPYSALPAAEHPRIADLGIGFPRVYIEFENNEIDDGVFEEYKNIITENAPLTGGQIVLLPCKILALNFELVITSGNASAIRSIAEETIRNTLSQIRPYISGVDLERNDTIINMVIGAAVHSAVESFGNVSAVIIRSGNTPINDYTLSNGEIPVFSGWWV